MNPFRSVLLVVLFCTSIGFSNGAALQSLGEAESNWPGINFQVIGIKRIPANRLLFSVILVATPKAPASGTYIGRKPTNPEDTGAPFSLSASTLTDEKTKQTFSVLKPEDGGQQYISGEIQAVLRPGQMEVMTVQFDVPPPLPESGGDGKQYVLLHLANAKAPIRLALPDVKP